MSPNRSFTQHILSEYRASQQASRKDAPALRQRADTVLLYLRSLQEQHVSWGRDVAYFKVAPLILPRPLLQALFDRYRGGDPDASRSVRSAANFVGLEVPAGLPLGRLPVEMAAKYASQLQKAAAGGPAAEGAGEGGRPPKRELTGVANLKAQLYGSGGEGGAARGSAPPAAGQAK